MSLTRSGSEGVKAATFPASSAASLARAQSRGGAGASTSASAHPSRGEAAGVDRQRRRRRCCPPARVRVEAGPSAATGTAAGTKKTAPGRRARKRISVPARGRPDFGRVEDPGAQSSQGSRNGSSRLGSRGMKAPLTLLRFPAPQSRSRGGPDEDGSDWGPLDEFCPGNFLCASPKAACVYAYVSTQAAALGHTA